MNRYAVGAEATRKRVRAREKIEEGGITLATRQTANKREGYVSRIVLLIRIVSTGTTAAIVEADLAFILILQSLCILPSVHSYLAQYYVLTVN
ncbi:hypothetical protein KQX54_016764 [Cotesia glomerata]|uniref:Uncharacterized protein n=1 Tax=Cotesia glomerata TaxID=32391 RepID=A0AAV7I1H4_COTGL|nr:hypothetical protein KQX54_016764 [Cotesia glomerata]